MPNMRIPMADSGAPQTAAAIDAFIERQAALDFLNDFDIAMQGRERRLPARGSAAPNTELAWSLYELARSHFFMLRVACLKLAQLAKGIKWAITAGNPMVQISLTRSLLEHTAALAFQLEKLAGLEEDLSKQDYLTKLQDAVRRHQSTVEKLYFGDRSPDRGTTKQKHFHVNDYRKVLRKDYPDEEQVYDALCDFVHPNFGSNSLVSSGTLGKGSLDRPYGEYEAEIKFASTCTRRCLQLADEYETYGSALLIKFDSRIEIAGNPSERPSAVFSQKGLAHTGDGKTKDTAVCFVKARTHQEAIEMFYRFLASQNMTLRSRAIAVVEGGFLFEEVQTDKGVLWVSTKMDW
jgi:hypothetical protein